MIQKDKNLTNTIKQSVNPNADNYESGLGNSILLESVPNFASTPAEYVLNGQSNAFIVFGRDRPGDRFTGYGGMGKSGAANIDIVVGRSSANPISNDRNTEEIVWVNNSFAADASRVYISQRTDVDKNFGLAEGRVGNRKDVAAIGIKSDELRFMARGGIKIVTGVGSFDSKGQRNISSSPIDLIGDNNSEDIQPLVKGDNMAACVEELTEKINEISGVVALLIEIQMQYNQVVANHTHRSPFYGMPTSPALSDAAATIPLVTDEQKASLKFFEKCTKSLISNRVNLESFKIKYLTELGERPIKSPNVNCT
jgi:hypothetical protein